MDLGEVRIFSLPYLQTLQSILVVIVQENAGSKGLQCRRGDVATPACAWPLRRSQACLRVAVSAKAGGTGAVGVKYHIGRDRPGCRQKESRNRRHCLLVLYYRSCICRYRHSCTSKPTCYDRTHLYLLRLPHRLCTADLAEDIGS